MATSITSLGHDQPPRVAARTLDRLVETTDDISGVWADSLRVGDWVVVKTKNSVDPLAVLGFGFYRVAGGWFKSGQVENQDIRIAGCTWGGAAIHTRLVAAVGMYLEFENGVRTTRIREVSVMHAPTRTH